MSDYRLVPTELTDEMIEASGCEGYFKMSPHEQAQEMWEAMLAAAPAVRDDSALHACITYEAIKPGHDCPSGDRLDSAVDEITEEANQTTSTPL